MTLHKLSAGDGYTYLTKQVAHHDMDGVKGAELAAYYSEKGEAPGRWTGAGLVGLTGVEDGNEVTEAQMAALFGAGRHPNADAIAAALLAQGASPADADVATRLGRAFPQFTAVNEYRRRCAQRYVEALAAADPDFPVAFTDDKRAAIRTDVARQMFAEEHGRPPADGRELTGFVIAASRRRAAVAGYDLTFSPVKSVSALWALAPLEQSRVIEAAHDAAVAATLAWLEREAIFSRLGRHSVRQVEVTGLIAAAFTHRDARSGDPDLHTHVAISNKVQTPAGQWVAIDGRVLHKAAVSASERYNTHLEAELRERLGVVFADRPNPDPRKRSVREVVGVDPALLTAWSTRRQAIDTARGDLERDFHDTHGRPPTPAEQVRLAQQANLTTRPAKHAPRTLTEQRATWRAEALDVFAHHAPPGVAPQRYAAHRVDTLLTAAQHAPNPAAATVTDAWVAATAAEIITTMEASRATWQQWHVIAEVHRLIRRDNIHPTQREHAAAAVTQLALSPACSLPLTPPPTISEPETLRRSTGASMYDVAGATVYTSARILTAEDDLLRIAQQEGGRVIDDRFVDLALAESAATGLTLNDGQTTLVREFATSGRRVQVAIAPAGSGKTTAMRVLARAWTDAGGTVLGLAPTAVAAAGLADHIDAPADTLAKLVHHLTHPDAPTPTWLTDITPDTLVLVDEAAMASTTDLHTALTHLVHARATIRLIGDDHQLTSLASGGILRDIATTTGALTLTELMRFTDPAEAAATLALRAGDATAIGYYLDHHRVAVGTPDVMTDDTFTAWAADRAAGHDTVMLAARRDIVADLNTRARTHRLTHTTTPVGPEIVLADGCTASVGDTITTRRNDRTLRLRTRDHVRNGYRFTITAITPTGDLTARHLPTGAPVTLPRAYVTTDVDLGYACTIHTAQGITADAAHVLGDDTLDRHLLYVGLTRGRNANTLHLIVTGDPTDPTHPDVVHPRTPTDILTSILARDTAQASATTARTEAVRPERLLGTAADRYYDTLGVAAEHLTGPDDLATITATVEQLVPGATADAAYPLLRSRLALIHLAGGNVRAALGAAVDVREVNSADATPAVLDYRLEHLGWGHTPDGPLPWLPGIPDPLNEDPTWGRYLRRRADLVTDLTTQIRDTATSWTASTAPGWVTATGLPTDHNLIPTLAVFRYATGVDDTDITPTGPTATTAALARYQRHYDDLLATAVGTTAGTVLTDHARSLDPHLLTDPTWPAVRARLLALTRAGIDTTTAMDTAAATGPLPDDLPAAALWWRIAATTDPGALTGAGLSSSRPPAYRPAWLDSLTTYLGAARADVVHRSPSWAGLLAAVNQGQRAGQDPDHLIAVAAQMIEPDRPAADGGYADADLSLALTLRVLALTRHTDLPFTHTAGSATPEPPDEEHDAPPDPQAPDEPTPADLLHAYPGRTVEAWSTASAQQASRGDRYDPDDFVMPDENALQAQLAELALRRATDTQNALNHPHPPPAPAPLTSQAQRILALNEAAATYYAAQLPTSWALGYLHQRLGDATHAAGAGYAPNAWAALTDHLRQQQAVTDDELLTAGLARISRRGTLIDAFRDRLVLPLTDTHGIVGFVARRNPTLDEDPSAGPKYLNTATTPVYVKSRYLFGLTDRAQHPDAVPVVVEGPLDALAVTATTDGRYIGVAPLGTALTDDHVAALQAAAPNRRVIVATDNDPAGQKAAERAYWTLTNHNIDPDHAPLPDGLDPADLLRRQGPRALSDALDRSRPLAATLIDRAAPTARHPSTFERVIAAGHAASVIAASHPCQWQAFTALAAQACGVAPATVTQAVLSNAQPRTGFDGLPTGASARAARDADTAIPRSSTNRALLLRQDVDRTPTGTFLRR